MKSKMRTVTAGETLIVSAGTYSDYRVMGLFTVLKNFSPDDELDAYLEEHPEEKERYHFNEERFMAHLYSRVLLADIRHAEFHLGDYGDSNEVSLNDANVTRK